MIYVSRYTQTGEALPVQFLPTTGSVSDILAQIHHTNGPSDSPSRAVVEPTTEQVEGTRFSIPGLRREFDHGAAYRFYTETQISNTYGAPEGVRSTENVEDMSLHRERTCQSTTEHIDATNAPTPERASFAYEHAQNFQEFWTCRSEASSARRVRADTAREHIPRTGLATPPNSRYHSRSSSTTALITESGSNVSIPECCARLNTPSPPASPTGEDHPPEKILAMARDNLALRYTSTLASLSLEMIELSVALTNSAPPRDRETHNRLYLAWRKIAFGAKNSIRPEPFVFSSSQGLDLDLTQKRNEEKLVKIARKVQLLIVDQYEALEDIWLETVDEYPPLPDEEMLCDMAGFLVDVKDGYLELVKVV